MAPRLRERYSESVECSESPTSLTSSSYRLDRYRGRASKSWALSGGIKEPSLNSVGSLMKTGLTLILRRKEGRDHSIVNSAGPLLEVWLGRLVEEGAEMAFLLLGDVGKVRPPILSMKP